MIESTQARWILAKELSVGDQFLAATLIHQVTRIERPSSEKIHYWYNVLTDRWADGDEKVTCSPEHLILCTFKAKEVEIIAQPKMYAFWRYDLFPFIVGGEVITMLKDGKVKTVCGIVNPLKVLPLAGGLELAEYIKKAETRFDATQKTLKQEAKDDLNKMLAAYGMEV